MVSTAASAEVPVRRRDAERTREEILEVAAGEFSRQGYAGARVDEIAAKTRTTKRMIYYYFGGKEQLYIAVLERAYSVIRTAEARLDVKHLDPVAAIRKLATATLDHHQAHPEVIRLIAIENIHNAAYIAKSKILKAVNTPAVTVTERILERGYADGVFRRRVEALDVHMMISAFSFFRIANRHTFGAVFGCDLTDPANHEHHRQMLGDLIVSYLTTS